MQTASKTFEVASVERATEPLPMVAYREAVEHLLGEPLKDQRKAVEEQIALLEQLPPQYKTDDRRLIGLKDRLSLLQTQERAESNRIEACSRYHGQLVAGVLSHPVIASLHHGFAEHRPLTLSPDMIWLLICQGFADHVNAHSERLRGRLVAHSGRARIEVRRDDFIQGSPENPWADVVHEFSRAVGEHLGATRDLLLPRFSTTTAADQAAAEIVLLAATQSYFEFHFRSLCGIPAISLEGTVADWQALADRADALEEFDLAWWLAGLRPVLRQFVAAARGEIEKDFWNSIYKWEAYSGGVAVTGWIVAFFPYLVDSQGRATVENRWLREGGSLTERILSGRTAEAYPVQSDGPSPSDFPSGLARVPFVWHYLATRRDMEFMGGFLGIAQDPQTLRLRPEIGWVVRGQQADSENLDPQL